MSDTAIIIRDEEGNDPTIAKTTWDSILLTSEDENAPELGIHIDWVVADVEEELVNRGGLQSRDQLGSAIILQLLTKGRRPDWLKVGDEEEIEFNGWHGDSFDIDKSLGEREIGSLLWTLKRALLDKDTEKKAVTYASMALQTFIDQGFVDHFMIEAEVDGVRNLLLLHVEAFPSTGPSIFANTVPISL